MSKTIGINLGSHIVTVYAEGEGIVLREPNAVAVGAYTREALATGQDAINMYNKTPGAVELITHIYQGNVSDYERMAMVMEQVFKKIGIRRPDVIFAVHGGHSIADIEAITEMMEEAGAKKIWAVDLPTVAVMGAGMPLNDERALLICDIGAATSEIGIVKGCVTKLSRTVQYGCNKLDEAIVAYVKDEYDVVIEERVARKIREEIGSVHPSYDVGSYTFTGRDCVTGLPCELTITSTETIRVMKRFADYLCANIDAILKKLPEKVLDEIKERGIMLTGGGALDGGIKTLMEDTLGLSVEIAQDPIECSVKGLGMIIENRKVFAPLLKDLDE